MLTEKTRRNIWLTFSIVSVAVTVSRIIRFADGSAEWWSVLSAAVIAAACIKFYSDCRRRVNAGRDNA